VLAGWRRRAQELRRDVIALYLACRDPACRDPRVPWYAKAFAAVLVAYALSPIDLIPDFIPVLGYLDELVLLPLGVLLAMKMIPAEILTEYRRQAVQVIERPTSGWGAALIIAVWLLVAGAGVFLTVGWLKR
jgi:uncharacterized membrane protein YkvA (DUF1232 family)